MEIYVDGDVDLGAPSPNLHTPSHTPNLPFNVQLPKGSAKRVPLATLDMKGGSNIPHRELHYRPMPATRTENERAIAYSSLHNLSTLRNVYEIRLRELVSDMTPTQAHTVELAVADERRRRIVDERTNHPARLSMPEISDDSGSEPDVSILGNRGTQAEAARTEYHNPNTENVHDERLGAEDTSIEDEEDFDDDEDEDHYGPHVDDDDELEGDEQQDEQPEFGEPLADPAAQGLKEISNLGRFTVSSQKQGNGVEELRNEDLNQYWQSDGPQPHKLTVYFIKRVGIRDLRFYVNFVEDESYTPTSITFKSGTSENNLIQFAHLTLDSPVGWQKVPLEGAGGGPDGNTLVSYVLQMQILENHQNGKDTHLRGIKMYAFDMDSTQAAGRATNPFDEMVEIMIPATNGEGDTAAATEQQSEEDQGNRRLSGLVRQLAEARVDSGDAEFTVPDFMRDPELR